MYLYHYQYGITRIYENTTYEALLKLGESTEELKKACGNSTVLIQLSIRAFLNEGRKYTSSMAS